MAAPTAHTGIKIQITSLGEEHTKNQPIKHRWIENTDAISIPTEKSQEDIVYHVLKWNHHDKRYVRHTVTN